MKHEKETIRCEAIFNEGHTHRYLWRRVWNKATGQAAIKGCESNRNSPNLSIAAKPTKVSLRFDLVKLNRKPCMMNRKAHYAGLFCVFRKKSLGRTGNSGVDFGDAALGNGTLLALSGTLSWHYDGTFVSWM